LGKEKSSPALSYLDSSLLLNDKVVLPGTIIPFCQLLPSQNGNVNTQTTHIHLQACIATKATCELVYRTELGKVVSVSGVIRGIFLRQQVAREVAVLENGLPIPTQDILHIRRMEG
jgi:hypothetical protein